MVGRSSFTQKMVASLLVIVFMTNLFLGALLVRPKPAEAFLAELGGIILVNLVNKGVNELFNPNRTEVWPVFSAIIETETPDGKPLPPVLISRQQAVIMQKGVRIRAFKPGVNGPPLRRLEYYRDNNKYGVLKLEAKDDDPEPLYVGTGRGHTGFDTADASWRPFSAYTLGLTIECDRSLGIYGRLGCTAVQVVIVDETVFRLAVTDLNYRRFLVDGMGTVPNIPVTRIVDGAGNMSVTVGNGGPSDGLSPSPAGVSQQREGLTLELRLGNQPVTGAVTIPQADLAHQPLVIVAGPLVIKTIAVFLDGQGKQFHAAVKEGVTNRQIYLSGWPRGCYTVQVQGQAADGAMTPPSQLQITIE